ncbi:MAG: MFS transporter, partial [Actinoplanes sp.]
MSLLPTLGRSVGTGVRAARLLVRGSVRGGAWATRRVGSARAKGAANEIGMIRLFDLHAISCAGDTLIAIGLAGTIFFNVPLGEARSKVALYLLITMVPFALLAPVVGPLLDHFRHGRRYALAVTMLGRAFLAYVISDHIGGWGLYPAAFGVLALSRAYGVARSAAVPRLLPEGIGLSQVGARASVYGTF